MRGLERNMRYGVRKARNITLCTYGCAIFLGVYLVILNVNTLNIFSIPGMLTLYLNYSVIMGTMMIIFYTAVQTGVDFHLMLAAGSTRKCAAVGLVFTAMITALMHIVVNLALTLLGAALFPEILFEASYPVQLAGMYLLAVGMGILDGVIVFRFGKIGYFVVVVLTSAVMGISYGYTVGAGLANDSSLSAFYWMELLPIGALDVETVYRLMVLAAVVLIALAGMLLVRVTRKAEVRV